MSSSKKVIQNIVNKALDEKKKKASEFRKEASRMVSMANKRLRRLEKAGLTDSPAYKKWSESGEGYFSVKGKDHNQLQKEVARMRQFINSQTSTIRGINTTLKEMAKNTGIKYKNLTDLRAKASTFFELSSKVEQYLRTVDDMASSIGYQKIWQAVNEYVKKEQTDLSNSKLDIDKMVHEITKAMNVYDEPINLIDNVWFTLPKD